MIKQYFPLGLAKGLAFCNRVNERNRLKTNINATRHTLVVSPRRYGKSSLVLYVLNELKIQHAYIDLFVAINEQKIEQEILEGVKHLINQSSTVGEKIFQLIKDQIKKLKLKLIIGTDGVNLELTPSDRSDPALNIKSTLLLLEQVLVANHKRAVFFIDEFQEIGGAATHKGIEGAIRHVAQQAQNLTFIFSGSNRHLLSQMFADRSRPLYKLCDRMTIGRIHAEDYATFIQKIAIKQWQTPLPENILNQLFKLTELHPYYMNVLCGRVWDTYPETLPTKIDQINDCWSDFLKEQKSDVAKELAQLSELQKKLMIYIALGKNQKLTGKLMLTELNTTGAAVIKALRILEANDYIFSTPENGYNILDPVIKSTLKQEFSYLIQ